MDQPRKQPPKSRRDSEQRRMSTQPAKEYAPELERHLEKVIELATD